jgi:hypothetical protein
LVDGVGLLGVGAGAGAWMIVGPLKATGFDTGGEGVTATTGRGLLVGTFLRSTT